MMERKLPEGWEIKQFLECIEKEASSNKLKIPKIEFQNKGEYPIIDQGAEYIAGYTDNPLKVYKGELPVIIFGDHTRIFKFVDFPFSLGADGTKVLVPKKDLLYPKYFYFFLHRLKIESHGYSRHYKFLKEKQIVIPPPQTQKKIVSILEKADETKRLRMQADELTNQLLQSVFLEMFGDPVKNPKGWEIKELKEMGFVKTGNTPPRKNPEYYGNYIEWIKSDNINTPYTYLTKSEEMLSEEGVKVGRTAPKNSVLVTCIAGSISCIGNVAIADRDVAFNQQINAIIPKEHLNDFFLYYLILSSKSCIQNSSTQGMKGMISKSAFESLRFICPPSYLQDKFRKYAEEVEKLKNYQKQSQQEIDNLFNALMQKAFKGELVA